jgi:prophage antirepressor-like protein
VGGVKRLPIEKEDEEVEGGKMQDNIIIFNFDESQVRTQIDEHGNPLFCASDVARVLGYKNTNKAIGDHCYGVTKRYLIDSMGRKQETNFLYEPDLYRLITRSRLPEAIRFEKWVFEVVLPSIRKTGGYSINEGISIGATRKQLAQKWKETAQMLIDSENEKEIVERKRQIAEVALGKAVKRIDDIEPAANVGRNFIANANSMKLSSAAKRLKVGEMTISVPMFLEYLKYRKVIEYISSPNKNGPDEKEIYPKHNFLPWFEQHSEYISSSNKNKNGSDKKKISPKSGFESWFEQHRSNISKKGLQWVLKPEGFAEMKQRMLEDPDFFRWSVELGSKELRDEVKNGEGNPEWEWKVKRKEERKKIDEWLCKDEY